MAPASAQTVFGFGSGLDWRPTCFVNPFPPSRVCSACGLVPSSAAMLACRHLLCHSCYDGGGVGGKRRHCPLDKEPFQEEDVAWTTIGRDSVLGRKVRCWNAEHGCDAEDVASVMMEHFTNACQFHIVRCPSCGEGVLHRDIKAHLESCGAPSCTSEQLLGDNFANAFMEVKEALSKILEGNAALCTKLNSFEDRLRPEINGSFRTQSPSVADAVTDALENVNAVLRDRTEATLREYRAVKEALSKLSEENAAVQTKLESLEQNLDMDSAMAKLTTVVSHALRVAVEKTRSACRAETEAALDERWGGVTSEIRGALAGNEQAMKEVISQECERNMLGLKDRVVEALRLDHRPADGGASSLETAEKRTEPVQDEVTALQLLAVVSLSIPSDFLFKSAPYEWTINDWAGFCDKAPRSAQYFTGNDGQPSYHYGFLIVPRLCFGSSMVWLHAFIIEGLFDTFLKWPMDKTMKLIFINPCDCTRKLTIKSAVTQVVRKPLPECSKKVVFTGRSDKIPVETLHERGVIGNNQLRLRLEFEDSNHSFFVFPSANYNNGPFFLEPPPLH